MYWLSQDDIHTGTRRGRLAAGSVGMTPGRDLHRPYPRQYARAGRRIPIGEEHKRTDNAVRIHRPGPMFLHGHLHVQDEQTLQTNFLLGPKKYFECLLIGMGASRIETFSEALLFSCHYDSGRQ